MEILIKLLAELRKARIYVVLLVFIGFFAYIFKEPLIKRFSSIDAGTGKYLETSRLVNDMLTNMLHDTKSDRAYVFLFHNGVTYMDGSHKKKFSCDFEIVRNGVQPQAFQLQDMPISLFPDFISEVKDSVFSYKNIKDVKDYKTRMVLESQGITSLVVYPYFNKQGHLFAMVGVDYLYEPQCLSRPIVKKYAQEIGEVIEMANQLEK